jgi:hypothetical protein
MTKLLEIAKQCGAKTRAEIQFIGESSIIFGTEDQLRAFMNTVNSGDVFGYVMQPAFTDDILRSTICKNKHSSYQIPVFLAAPQQAIPATVWKFRTRCKVFNDSDWSEWGKWMLTERFETIDGLMEYCKKVDDFQIDYVAFAELSAAPTAPIESDK